MTARRTRMRNAASVKRHPVTASLQIAPVCTVQPILINDSEFYSISFTTTVPTPCVCSFVRWRIVTHRPYYHVSHSWPSHIVVVLLFTSSATNSVVVLRLYMKHVATL
jgi:hypothetical protein